MTVGHVRFGKGSRYAARRDPHSKNVYVDHAGCTYVGKAGKAAEAMTKVEAWLYDK